MNILNSTACLASTILFSASLHAAPLKVYILAGQSNMQGHSAFKTLGHLKTDDTTKHFYDAIVDEAGNNYISAFGYHFSGSAKFFVQVGDAMAKAFYTKKDQ